MARGDFATARTTPQNYLDSPASWTVVGAAFLSMFAVFAVHYSFGSFFGSMADEFDASRGTTALFFAITNFLYFALGVLTGRAADRFGPRRIMLFGAACLVAGLVITSRVNSIWVGYATYGIGVGMAVACGYVPMVATVGSWFEKRRTTALGVAVAGIGAGTLAGAPLAEFLIRHYGWRDTYVMFAIMAGALLIVASFGADQPPVAGTPEAPMPVWETIRHHRGFWVLWGASVLLVIPLFVPFVYLPDYMEQNDVSGSAGLLIGIIGVSSVIGRLSFGIIGARLSVIALYKLSFLIMGLSFLLWLAAGSSYALLVVFTIVLGVSYGGFIALSPAVAAQLFGVVGLGGILGALYTAAGVGGLIGPPLIGILIDAIGYRPSLIITMILALLSAAMLYGFLPTADGDGAAATAAGE